MGLRLFGWRQTAEPKANVEPGDAPARAPRAPVGQENSFEPADKVMLAKDPLHRELQLERYGFILDNLERWRQHPAVQPIAKSAAEAIDEQFALVPEGFASLPLTIQDLPGCPEEDIETEPFLLARHAVTNAQFQKFVDAGGYEDLELWPKDIWPHIIDFQDQTKQPGPRFWREGVHDRRLAGHPVVGVCYYEAAAYAQWAGYRLPTESEWQMAASWRIRSSANVLRRYPWGDALDRRHCNIWASGVGTTAPVDAYASGAAPNGVLQLIGNVWEWTASDYIATDDQGNPIIGSMHMKGVRGGSFDTYFASQATSCFRTGLACLIRAHNVGFRCALDLPSNNG